MGMTSIATLHTHLFMQAHDVWKSRLANIRRRLSDESKDKTGVFKEVPWKFVLVRYIFAIQNCSRAKSYAESQRDREPAMRRYLKSHPDYVKLERLKASIESLEKEMRMSLHC
jgi:hypothetical protein